MSGFKLYTNKSSFQKRRSRMLNGGDTEVKGNKLGWWERKPLPRDDATDITFEIDEEYSKRPHLVAFDFYGLVSLTWLVLQYNNIVDIEEEFVRGKTITIPSRSRALTLFTGGSIRNNA